MKKTFLRILVTALLFILPAASGFGGDMDVVVMVDVTWSLTEHFNDIEQYLLGALLSDVLKDGDTFHLLWFSDHPETLVTGQVTDSQSREEFRARLRGLRNLQWTYGHYTDLVGAVSYLISFTDTLPKDHKKLILLVTDGIHDPAPGTATPADQEALKRIFMSQAEEIKKRGWSIHILKTLLEKQAADAGRDRSQPFLQSFDDGKDGTVIPFTDEGKGDMLSDAAGLPRIVFPGHLGTVGKKTSLPFVVKNPTAAPVRLTLDAVMLGGRDILVRPVTVDSGARAAGALNAAVEFPADLADGEQTLSVVLVFHDNPRLVGATGTLSLTYRRDLAPPLVNFTQNLNVGFGVFPLWVILAVLGGIIILIVLILVILAVVRNRGFHFSMRRTLGADAIGRRARFGHRRVTEFEKTPRHSFAIEMIVDMQRRHIGQRNIRTIKRNRALTIGGGRSAFLIFLVPVPKNIAKIHYDGENFTFKPVKPEFFPGLTEDVPKCLNQEIKAVSKKNYPLEIVFHRYVSPMEEITIIFNRLKEQSNVKDA
jgi:hypothetical protein